MTKSFSILLILGIFGQFSCVDGGSVREGGFERPQLGPTSQNKIQVVGQTLSSTDNSQPILIEVYKAGTCPQGLCPMIGLPPLASIEQQNTGSFSLFISHESWPLIVVATQRGDEEATRVAHQILENSDAAKAVILSFDRPYKAFR